MESAMDPFDLGFFDPHQGFSVYERHLPHWIQAGALCFVTWRLSDSLPSTVVKRIDAEINALLIAQGLNPDAPWKDVIRTWAARERGRLQWKLFQIRDRFLDRGYGNSWFTRAECSQVVASALKHFDGTKYFLTDFVVMPNHVHYIAAFPDEAKFLKQNTDLKRFISRQVNEIQGRRGDLWQPDQFDHMIRSISQFDFFRTYIGDNPRKARLKKDTYRHFRKDLG